MRGFKVELIVETGEGLADANSYTSLEFASNYFNSKGDEVWLLTSDLKQSYALIAATEYIDHTWGPRLKGRPLVSNQSREFPRSNCFDRYGKKIVGVPTTLQQACSLYALYSTTASLWAANSTSGSAKEVLTEKVTVGPITTETTYTESQKSNARLYFPQADALMRQFLSGANGGVIR
ncbi:head completion adaptor [Alteromonas phage vB_AcoS-R7M]|uniref:Head completion adaptor n=1 Tax=Alteromonas phage vB_AcoS-R7M TaxID=2729541 RepID=A0A6M3YNL9_9CAUD|nr:head-tail adaptor Ad1 [Alteromonas phage vB_AcoS-R7M]QJI53351.1 head completion adaptor [Alteromonas phage vB_AcoS-R7M]